MLHKGSNCIDQDDTNADHPARHTSAASARRLILSLLPRARLCGLHSTLRLREEQRALLLLHCLGSYATGQA